MGGESVSAQVAEIIEPHLSDDCASEGGFHSVYGATKDFPCVMPLPQYCQKLRNKQLLEWEFVLVTRSEKST